MERELHLLILLLAQAATSAAPEEVAATVPPPCEAQRPAKDEIVVCAGRQDGSSPYRINQPPAREPRLPKAEVQIAQGVSAGAETEQAVIGGFPFNRMMVRLKIKF